MTHLSQPRPARRLLHAIAGMSALLFSPWSYAAPVADIKANNSDTALAIAYGSPLTVTVGMTPDTLLNQPLDWWLVRENNAALYSWSLAGSWASGLVPTYQGNGFALASTAVFSSSSLDVGVHNFYFGVDSVKNGSLDLAGTTYDSIAVHVYNDKNNVADGLPYIDVYNPAKACNGTTLLADIHDKANPRVIEVDMLGRIVWQYLFPNVLKGTVPVGPDAKFLANGNVLITLSSKGVYEVSRAGSIVWSVSEPKVSHDADRLANGNTLVVFGNNDTADDSQLKEYDASGKLVWSWSAKNLFYVDPYKSISDGGWTHANAASRLTNGNTLVNMRNFDLTAEISPAGALAWSFDWGKLGIAGVDPHEPEIQANDNLLVCLQNGSPYQAVEIARSTGQVVWGYKGTNLRTARDCNRLPNGNTLIVAVMTQGTSSTDDDESVLFEVTSGGEIVWQMRLKNAPVGNNPGDFYKAQRSC